MPVPFNIVGIDHVVLRAADPTKLERFYVDALGLTFEKRQGELAQFRAGNALIDIVPADEAGPAGGTSSTGGANLDHLCLRIEPFDQAAITKHLAKASRRLWGGDLALRCRGQGPVHLLSRSRRQRHRVKRSGLWPIATFGQAVAPKCRTCCKADSQPCQSQIWPPPALPCSSSWAQSF
jgi:glyoxylase I family protein